MYLLVRVTGTGAGGINRIYFVSGFYIWNRCKGLGQ